MALKSVKKNKDHTMQKKEPIKKRNFSKKCPNKNFLQQNKSLKE